MFYYIMDSLEKSLINHDEAFDKLFDIYNEIKEEKIPSFIKRLKDEKITSIQKRIIINLLSLENYAKNIIENLIREDVTSNSDYNFCKLIIPKIENDTYMLHFLSFTLEYGYEYTGFQSNFLILPECEKMYFTFSNAIFYKKPMHIYGIQETGKKEILEIFTKLCGKRINYINSTLNYDITSFNKVLYGNIKYGTWICIDQSQNIKFELLEILAGKIMEIYRIVRGEIEGEDFADVIDKTQNSFKHTNIIIYRDLSFNVPFNIDEIPKIIKSYYRQIAIPKINLRLYFQETLINLNIENAEEIANKILYIINYANNTLNVFNNKSIMIIFISNIISAIINKIIKNGSEELNLNIFLKDLIKKKFEQFLSGEEQENNRKFLNEVFEIKEYSEEIKPFKHEDPQVEEIIKKELSDLKINSPIYENKISLFYDSVNHFNNFILLGPPLSGKSNLVGLINLTFKQLNNLNKNKYPKFLNIRIFPKSRTPNEIFSDNIVSKSYRIDNNYFYDMLYLFNEENEEIITKLDEYYDSLLKFKLPEIDEDLTPQKINEMFTKTEDNMVDENSSISYHREEDNEKKGEKKTRIIIFDGSIDDTWIQYINNLYDKDNYLTLSNGYKLNFRDNIKLFFETTNLKNTPPSFLSNQMIISCSYEYYSWDVLLYIWIESNPKVTENKTLKNYLRGLFENYFPKVYEFIENNKIKNLNLSANYVMQSLINLFDSIFPMFNFEDIKIGRKNFNVIPKIELIKKCTLSMFIFCCAWTMNLLTNYVIKTKIEKIISDLFKADDLKGPIFDYYIDDETNDFELWSNLQKNENYMSSYGQKDKMFNYGKIFIHTLETIPYTWICEKLIDNDKPFYFNGKEGSGKSFLLSTLFNKKSEDEMEIKKLKILASYYTNPDDIENSIYKNLTPIKRDLYGDKYIKQICLFIDDLNMNINKDKYGTSHLFEFLRQISCNKFLYDIKTNQNRYLKKFNIYGCGNISAFPYDEEFNRFIVQFNLITYVTNDDYYLLVFKPSLEFHLRKNIPNTSGVTSTQYVQVLLKLNQLLKNGIKKVPSKLHISFTIKDTINILQSFHLYVHKSTSEYPEYLKKLFFYEGFLTYGNKLNQKEDIEIFKKTICDAYSSIFKQDKTVPNDIFNEEWEKNVSFAFCQDYNNFNKDNNELLEEHCYINKKTILIDFIKSKIENFYRTKDIREKNYIKTINENIEVIIKLLRILENNAPNIILLGKKNTIRRPLLHFASYIANIDFTEVDSSFSHELLKNKNLFIEKEIKPYLMKIIQSKKKSILYLSPNIKANYILDTIHKLMDMKEIPNNFKITDQNKELDEEEIAEEEIIDILEKNISICLDINYDTDQYINLFTKYSTIVKNSSIVYIHNWNEEDMKTYYNISVREIESIINEKIKTKIPDLLIDIYNYSNQLYENYYIKSGIKLFLDVKNYSNVCEFFISKYKEYKLILEEKQKKYDEGIKIVDKTKKLLDDINKEIKESVPKQEEFKKKLESKKEKKNNKTKEKNKCRTNKQFEDKTTKELMDKKAQKEEELDEKLSPTKQAIAKLNHAINKIPQNDLTDVRNAWESFNFGKFLIFNLYDLLNKPYSDWENAKRSLDLDTLKTLANINPNNIKENLKKKLYNITKEVVGNIEFTSGDKYSQKPFRLCGILCDFFGAWNKYFIQNEANKNIIDEINQIKNEIQSHEKIKKKIIEEGKIIDDEINKIEQEIRELETRNDNMNHQKLKLKALNSCFNEYYALIEEKLNIWKNKKSTIDIILFNYDFYLMIISCYLIYAAPLNKFYRNLLKKYLYSLSKDLKLENIKEFSICGIIIEFLDNTGKDYEFCSSVNQYSEFLADNFTMMYIMKNKIPYLIDSKRISYGIITKFLQLKSDKNIISTIYNDIDGVGDMFEKIEISMRSGSFLFIDQCEENIYDIFENLINEKSGYNAKTQKRFYIIKNKKIDKDENFKLFLINSKSSSKISQKSFRDCYVINFNCPSEVICGLITDKLCTEQDPETYEKINKTKNDININEFKLLELENKILNYNKQFDLTLNLDKLNYNQELLEKYKVEIEKYNLISTELGKSKKILAYDISELFRYQCICTDSTKIYKWCSRLFFLNNLYIFPIDYLSNLVKEFYKERFGIYKELKENEKQKKPNLDMEYNDSKNESVNEEVKSGEEASEEEDALPEKIGSDIPTYTSDNSIEFILYIYNKISPIYEPNKRKLLLLILLLNALNNREENSNNFKQILYSVYNIFIKEQIDAENYNFQSPISQIPDKVWNYLKQINEVTAYPFSLFLNDIENHKDEWESYLENEDILISSNFTLSDNNLENCFNPLTKFAFFTILKPELGNSLIDITINEILKKEELFLKELNLNNKNTQNDIDLKIEKNKILPEILKENISLTRKPILMFEIENGYLNLEKELKDYYLKKLKAANEEKNNNNNNKQEGIINDVFNYREINPTKMELSNVELEMIHNTMKIGGVIVIKNCLLIQESLSKLFEEFQDINTYINENFKLILLVKNNNLLPEYLYSSTNIIHHDFTMFKQMKEYIMNLINETPNDLFQKFMNSEMFISTRFHMKKIYIYLLIINAVLFQYSYIKSKIFKIPIDFTKKDLIITLKFVLHYMSSINEERHKALLDQDNSFGFNFDSIIKMTLDTFVSSRLIYREDEERVSKMLSQILDGEQFIKDNNNYFSYNDFVVPKINEKLYLKKVEPSQSHAQDGHSSLRGSKKNIPHLNLTTNIPKIAVIELFKNIPNEKFYSLLYGVSNEMIHNQTRNKIYEFYKLFCKNNTNDSFNIKKLTKIKKEIPEIFKIDPQIIASNLEEIKKSLPDQLNTTDANPILFKVNKFNELFNPFDACLQKEIDTFNMYLNKILDEINNINMIFQGDMVLNEKFYNILYKLSKNLVPSEWKKNNYLNQDVTLKDWLNNLNIINKTINDWIINGSLPVYDLSIFYNAKLFIATIPIYFQKKLEENHSVSSDKINIEYKITKYEKKEEINESVLAEIQKENKNKDFILIKGFRIKNFESFIEKGSRVYQENLDKKEGEELPIILVNYSINTYENIKEIKVNEEDEESDEEVKNSKLISGERKSQILVEQSSSKFESESKVKEYEEEEIDEVRDSLSSFTKQKKSSNIHSKSVFIKEKETKKSAISLVKKYKYITLKKYCKIDVPIFEEFETDIFRLVEPLGYIELRFKCTKDKQEEYFINNKIQIDIDN